MSLQLVYKVQVLEDRVNTLTAEVEALKNLLTPKPNKRSEAMKAAWARRKSNGG